MDEAREFAADVAYKLGLDPVMMRVVASFLLRKATVIECREHAHNLQGAGNG